MALNLSLYPTKGNFWMKFCWLTALSHIEIKVGYTFGHIKTKAGVYLRFTREWHLNYFTSTFCTPTLIFSSQNCVYTIFGTHSCLLKIEEYLTLLLSAPKFNQISWWFSRSKIFKIHLNSTRNSVPNLIQQSKILTTLPSIKHDKK